MFCSSRNGTDSSRNHAGYGFHPLPSFLASSSLGLISVLMRSDSIRAWLPSFLTCLLVSFFIPSLPSFLPAPSLPLPGCSFFFGAFDIWTESTLVWSQKALSPSTLTLWIGRRSASCYTILEPARLPGFLLKISILISHRPTVLISKSGNAKQNQERSNCLRMAPDLQVLPLDCWHAHDKPG